jgi:hypothetical protein
LHEAVMVPRSVTTPADAAGTIRDVVFDARIPRTLILPGEHASGSLGALGVGSVIAPT